MYYTCIIHDQKFFSCILPLLVVVHKNEMSLQMEHFVITKALLITGTETNLNIVAKNISNEMNNKFGKSWNCITGVNTSFAAIHLESEKKTLIWFSLNENHFIIFKQFTDQASKEVMIKN